MGTHRLATHGEEVIMKFFAVLASVLSAAAGEASLPIAAHHLATAGLYSGYHGIAAPYAAAYGQDARFAYGAPVTALNAGPLTAGPVAEAPVAAAVPALTAVAPVAVVDTPEVAEAKAAFHAAYAAEASRTKRSAQYPAGFVAPAAYAAVAPAAVAAAPAAPSREAVLTTIKLNPGHAVFYRVD